MPIRAVPSDFIGFARRKALNSMGLKGRGGEGGIRTPDSLATMSDFESGGESQAPNIYKGIILRKASVLAGVSICKASYRSTFLLPSGRSGNSGLPDGQHR